MLKKDQIVKLVTVTVNDILKEAGDVVTFMLDAVELKNKIVHVRFSVENTTLPECCNSSTAMKLRIVDLEKWVEEPVVFVDKIGSKISEALTKFKKGK